MIPIIQHDRAFLFHGEAGDLGGVLPPNSIDAIVTDPPAGIGFMGRDWDSDKGGRDAWIDWLAKTLAPAFRALKPGGHALVWAIPRTSHWTAFALENTGFEIRDRLGHLFKTGFPKNHDVSKAIDKKRNDRPEILKVTAAIAKARDAVGMTNAQIDSLFGCNGMAAHWTSQKKQPTVPTLEQWGALRAILRISNPELDAEIAHLNMRKGEPGENWLAREVTGVHEQANAAARWRENVVGTEARADLRRDKPATEEAEEAEGYGTALKPAVEDWWLVRKPPEGTIAENFLKYGTGALNIEDCKIDVGDGKPPRWPAHVMLDEEAAEFLGHHGKIFFCPKPTKKERERGCAHLPPKTGGEATGRKDGSDGLKNPRAGAGRGGGRRNFHPTIKPVALMRWLCRLITPKGGNVLDPFCGSASTALGAIPEGFNFIGCELGEEYVPIAKARIEEAIREAAEGEKVAA